MNFAEAIAKRIVELLRKNNMSQYRLIKESCLDKSTIQTILKGKTKDVRLSTIYAIADVFGMTISEFLNFKEFNSKEIEI